MNVDELVIKESDYGKLSALVDSSRTPAAERLEDELSRAEIVPDSLYPKDVVCLGANVGFVDLVTGEENEVTLVYPNGTDVQTMKISILTPMGCALIGMRAGGTIDWELPGARKAKIKVLRVTQN